MGNSCGAAKAAKRRAAASERMGTAASSALETSSDMSGAYSSGYGGGAGGYAYAMMCPEGIDQDIALLATSAALAVGIYAVYRDVISQTN
jgi:hypothetical protein